MYNLRGYYTPLTISENLFVRLSKSSQQAWKDVQDRQARLSDAKSSLSELQRIAEEAPEFDRQAAIAAVSAGRAVPKPTEDTARGNLTDRLREIEALTSLADQAEREFLAALAGERQSIAASARSSLATGLQKAVDALNAVSEELGHLYGVNGLWQWGRGLDEGITPANWRITAKVDGRDEDLRHGLGRIVEALLGALPDEVDQREADRQAWLAQQRGERATADGLVLDAAAYKAYR